MRAPPSLGDAIRRARLSAGLTRTQLANRLDVETTTIQSWELGMRAPSISTLLRVADVLDVAPGELLDAEAVAS